MRSHPSMLGMTLVCLIGVAACNRPHTELTPVSLRVKAAQVDMSAEDALITSHVKLALVANEGINGESISVSTRQGQVTLSGSLPARQIALAEEVARNVDGVRNVYNKLKPIGVMA